MSRPKRKFMMTDLVFENDPRCAHCAVLLGLQEFAQRERAGQMETGEMMFALLHVIVDIIATAPNAAARRDVEDYVIEELGLHGLNVMRIEGAKQ